MGYRLKKKPNPSLPVGAILAGIIVLSVYVIGFWLLFSYDFPVRSCLTWDFGLFCLSVIASSMQRQSSSTSETASFRASLPPLPLTVHCHFRSVSFHDKKNEQFLVSCCHTGIKHEFEDIKSSLRIPCEVVRIYP